MRHGSLFSGIGGFDLASEWMGWENVFHCEWNEFGQKVLKYYWPKAISYHDITKTDFSIHRGEIDIITGGFPCQPYSISGKRKGKEDERHLWPEMLRAIREVQPTWVVGENVLGLVNWDGGLVFHEVQAELEAQGYEVQPYVLPAASVNAPHRRDRVWFVAYSINCGYSAQRNKISKEDRIQKISREKMESRQFNRTDISWDFTDTLRNGYEGREERKRSEKRPQPNDKQSKRCDKFSRANFEMFPISTPICVGDDGISDRLDGITFSKWRNESIKAGGNAIVPQVVHQIFKAIQQYTDLEI